MRSAVLIWSSKYAKHLESVKSISSCEKSLSSISTPPGISAFGIFSVLHHKKTLKENPKIFLSFNQYQLSLVRGKYYITITNYDGSQIAQNNSKRLADKLVEKIHNPKVIFPSFFYHDSLRTSIKNLIYLKGILGLQSGYPQWIELLRGINFSSIFLMSLDSNEKKSCIVLLTLNEAADSKNLYKKLNVNIHSNAGSDWLKGNYKEHIIYLQQKNPTKILLFQSSESANKPENILDFLNINN